MELLSKIYTKFPVGYITIYSDTDSEEVNQILSVLKTVGLGRFKTEVINDPQYNGSIIAQRFNIGNFGKYSVVILKEVNPSQRGIDYSAFHQFAHTLLDITRFDSSPEVVITCEDCSTLIIASNSCSCNECRPLESATESGKVICKEKRHLEQSEEPETSFFSKIRDKARKIKRSKKSPNPQAPSLPSAASIANHEEDYAVYATEIHKKEYLDRISAIVLDYVTRFNEMPPMEQIEEILRGKLSIATNTISTIVVNRDFKVFLPAYNELELRFPPLLRTLYILFLNHPEGIVLKHISDYRNEIEDIYILIKPGGSDDLMTSSINELCDPLSDSLRQKLSKVNRIVRSSILNPELAENYIINGERGQAYRIKLDHSLITLPSCLH